MAKNTAPTPDTVAPPPDLSKSRKRFIKFVILVVSGVILGYLTLRKGVHLTPESFKNYVVSMGILGPIIYVGIFIIRPLFLIPSIALFVAGGLAFGPVVGPLYASFGAAIGGTLGFWIARIMGHDYVMSKLKLGAQVVANTKFNFSVVFLLSLLPIMPVTVINYGAGLSHMKFKHYITAHVLGLTPRAFAFGFFGSALLEIGSPKFRASLLLILILGMVTAYFRFRSKAKSKADKTESDS